MHNSLYPVLLIKHSGSSMRTHEGMSKYPHLAFSRNDRLLSPASPVSFFEAACWDDDDLGDVTRKVVVAGRT